MEKKRGTRHHGINGTDLGTTPQIRRNITTYSAKVEAEKRPSEWAMPHVQFWGDWKPVYETVSGKAKLINAFEQIANYIEQAATDGILFYIGSHSTTYCGGTTKKQTRMSTQPWIKEASSAGTTNEWRNQEWYVWRQTNCDIVFKHDGGKRGTAGTGIAATEVAGFLREFKGGKPILLGFV